jgi:putative nucleotidyltransferase with HDIG domain
MVLIGAPILIAINFGHRQYRDNLHQRIELLEKAHRETIEALAVAINAKDEVTHEHVLRVQIYAAGVARLLGCTDADIEALKAGALLHDIGKIAVPDYILNKPGKLTAAEFEKMKMHTIVGAQILGRVDFHYPVVPIVRHHHERWDGCGYPDGLQGEDIPLTARILTVVDCFDALREDRQYRRGLTREEAVDFLLKNSGSQYDPKVVGIFITHLAEFEAEIAAHKGQPLPTFGIETSEQLSEAAQKVAPGAGLAATSDSVGDEISFTRKELAAVYELVQALNGAGNRDQLMSAFSDKLSGIVSFDTCALTIIAPDTGQMFVDHATGHNSELIKGHQVTLGEGITGWVIANRESFSSNDPCLDFPVKMAESFGSYKTLAAFPLMKDGEQYGALTVYSMAIAEYDKDQQKLLREAAAVLADALSSISRKPETDVQAKSNASDFVADSLTEVEVTSLESSFTH